MYCTSCGLKVEEWEIPEDEWRVIRETNEPVICGYCNLLGESTIVESMYLARCDKCGHLWYECDTEVLNELVLCEDCIDIRDVWSRFQYETPARSEPQSESRSRADKTTERPDDSQVEGSPTPARERTDGVSKDPFRDTSTGDTQPSIEKNRDTSSQETETEKTNKRTVEQSGGMSVPPLAKQQEHHEGGKTKDRTERRTQSPVAQDSKSKVPRTGPKTTGEKGCLSATVLATFVTLAFIVMLMYTIGARDMRTNDAEVLRAALVEAVAARDSKPELIEVRVEMMDRES